MDTILDIGQMIDGYRVETFVKVSPDGLSESYFVADSDGNRALMKLRRSVQAGSSSDGPSEYRMGELFAGCGVFAPVMAAGTVTVKDARYDYLVRAFIRGTRLSDLIEGGRRYAWEEAIPIVRQVLTALEFLHAQEQVLLHNDVTARNVIIMPGKKRKNVCLIGTGHLSFRANGRTPVYTKDLNDWCRAPETFLGMYNERTDLFSVGALLYTMITGSEPWRKLQAPDERTDARMLRRLRTDERAILDGLPLDDARKCLLRGMLAPDYDMRFSRVGEVLDMLRDLKPKERVRKKPDGRAGKTALETDTEKKRIAPEIRRQAGGGFADVAGLTEVKSMLCRNFMFILTNRQQAEKYRLKVPNGVLLYGPPGCGKTFIAEKFAQESRRNFLMVKTSDLGSIYVHGTQNRIAEVFCEAEKKAPTVLCFDELDGMVPDRSKISNDSQAGEVNEFLSQLNNCSDRGIFVIGTSNRPEKIDPAVLRTGRMDRLVYIPVPDEECRRELFRIHLAGRFCDADIDCGELARRSRGYVASDIAFIVNDAALEAAIGNVPISQQLLLAVLGRTRRSVSDEEMTAYDALRRRFETGTLQSRRRIGFDISHV